MLIFLCSDCAINFLDLTRTVVDDLLEVSVHLLDVILLVEDGGDAFVVGVGDVIVVAAGAAAVPEVEGEVDEALMGVEVFLLNAQVAVDDVDAEQHAAHYDGLLAAQQRPLLVKVGQHVGARQRLEVVRQLLLH